MKIPPLSAQELSVGRLLAADKKLREIAAQTNQTAAELQRLISSLATKLEVEDRNGIVVWMLQRRLIDAPAIAYDLSRLTPRLRETLACFGLGLGMNGTARKLHVALETVKTHRQKLAREIGVDNSLIVLSVIGCIERNGLRPRSAPNSNAVAAKRPSLRQDDLRIATLVAHGHPDQAIVWLLKCQPQAIDQAFERLATFTGTKTRGRIVMSLLERRLIDFPRHRTSPVALSEHLRPTAIDLARGLSVEEIGAQNNDGALAASSRTRKLGALLGIPPHPILIGAIVRRDGLVPTWALV